MAKLHEADVDRLHPTQISVGMIEVHDKRKHLRELGHAARRDYLQAHPIPAVLGPERRLYLIDHHHLGRALHDEGIAQAFFEIAEDFSSLPPTEFWPRMDARAWVHPVDAQGRRRDWAAIPKQVKDLVDDPYRSLAGYVREAGGFAKTDTPFAEFVWADFFRRQLALDGSLEGFDAAVRAAIRLAQGPLAHGLPGFLGKSGR